MDDWEENDLDSSQFLPREFGFLLPSFQRKEKTEKRKTKKYCE